jgi:aminopeptidase N
MKYILLFSITFLFVNSIFSQENHTNCSKRDRFKNAHLKSNTLSISQITETEKYDVHFYGLDLSMTNVSTNLSGTVRIGAKSLVNLDTAIFELFPTLVITEIRLNGNSVGYNRLNTAVKVGVNLPANSNFELAIDYNGNPPTAQTNPLGGSGITAGSSPSWGNKVVWTLSEPFSAMEWFPCKQSLTDKADSSFFSITVPDTLKAGSNGLLVSVDTLGNGFLKFNWEHRHPIDYYLISASVAKYVDYSIFANPVNAPAPILIQNYIYDNPNTLTNFIDEINETASFIELYYDLYGPYPFEDEKYGHCMAPISGGMEHQTMTTQGFFEKKLTSHELGHQWWGDNVTCASWADIWINEGFASYSEYLMLENLYPAEKNQHMLDVHDNVMTQTGGSVWVLDSLNENRIFSGRLTYDKGAGTIHSIRYLVNNDSLFFNALRAFQIAYKDQTAKGVDFKDFVSVYTGTNLDAFFEEWYFGEGYPTYSVRWEQVGQDVLLEVSHTTSKPSITPTFTNPIDIKLNRAAAPDTIIRFSITSNTELFTISNIGPLSISATAIVDPNNWIMNKVGTVTQDNSLEISENLVHKDLFISPNPSEGVFTIQNLEFDASIRVIDMKGNTVSKLNIQPGESIDLTRLEKGTYLIEIGLPNGNKRLKLVQF